MSKMTQDQITDVKDVAKLVPSSDDLAVLTKTVNELYDHIKDLDQTEAFDKMLEVGKGLREQVPELSDILQKIASHKSYRSAVLVLPPPVESELIPTPIAYRTPEENKLLKIGVYRGLVLGLAGWYPYGYTSQQPGNILNDIVAIKEMSGMHGASANAIAELGLHTEDASYNLVDALKPDGSRLDKSFNASPDWLTLHFLRNPDKVPTFVSAPDLTKIDDKTLDLLHQPLFVNLTNPGQGGASNDSGLPVSILYKGDNGDSWIRANTANLIVAKDDNVEAKTAMDKFRGMLADYSVDLPTDPGCIVLIDNRRVLHGRRDYTQSKAPKWDGTDRWQQRVTCADKMEHVKQFLTTPHILDTQKLLDAVRGMA